MRSRAEHSRVDHGGFPATPRGKGRRGARRCLACGLLFALFISCRPASEEGREESIPTVDLPADTPFEPENDPQARPRSEGLTGILPTGFPKDLPVYLPSSIIDLGTSARGGYTVTLLSPHGSSQVRSALQTQLRAAGWTASETGGEMLLRKGQQRAWLRFEEGGPGTRYRIEYGI